MNAKFFKVIVSSSAPIEEDWSVQLVTLLGSRPRRLSRWCELGLFGGLSCISKTGQLHLPNDVPIRVYSEYATIHSTHKAIEQASQHLPMPFTFMQTQPSQLFNALGTALGWQGDGYTVAGITRKQSETALLRNLKRSALLGWVDEEPELISRWIWLEETDGNVRENWRNADSIFQLQAHTRWLKIDSENTLFEAG
ncbi:hypothetical protein EDC30_107153 [Paucimonas lemoignei]|uniref:Uncharacterized protein n=1 Tax=Paucimonas lemoignei TaxID=29443 RepID=A0A4R3HT19_PAULE|nr:hypothetical protein [Paucimonas lemoignei]TCS36336.1 hypothetical protein EDC30_107153 [Paucimonas lemoignei]